MAGRTQVVSTRRRKKPQTASVLGGIKGTYEDRDNDYVCPVCFDVIDEAHMTKCGHSFCYKCIKQSLEKSNRCPKCNYVIENPDQVYPNFSLNELILKFKGKQTEKKRKTERTTGSSLAELVELLSDDIDLSNVNFLLEVLASKKQKLEADGQFAESCILKEFLQQVRQRKQTQLDQLMREISILDADCQAVEDRLKEQHLKLTSCPDHLVPNGFEPPQPATILDVACDEGFNSSPKVSVPSQAVEDRLLSVTKVSKDDELDVVYTDDVVLQASGLTSYSQPPYLQTSLASRRKKISQHFEDLEQCYLTIRTSGLKPGPEGSGQGLDEFTNCLSKFTRYSSFRPLATLSYAVDHFNGGSSIVSSIEFDRDSEFFAIAGVTKKIKVYEYDTVIKDAVDIHYPIIEMVCQSKISCVGWSSYHKGGLASSDYEGTVTLWDANTGQRVKMFQEHEKRCWSVDYNRMDPRLLASGSDDCKVKLWSCNVDHSIASLEAKANVCCVKFNPESRFHLAFGSADHCVHYYDLRQTRQAVGVFRGHKKAVSYVKFLSSEEIVSASTDSQLKLWDLKRPNSICTFTGHTNEKNFVGLATDGDYVSCGSENNSLYLYYKGLSKHIMTYKFDTVRSVLEKERKDDDSSEFVSAVTWKPGANVLVAANSQGTVKVLEIV
ncbi:E3 ubiquitin-protein ligase COP1-like isoform X2 [Pomacea canaliculata]|uniref:E3 ubiquitin-protein ligase COP1-like isoform X2 n=1 Tax=Pomacea canaliculata TaxID=400727 RepID=UPI000D727C6A|nr:E3 ubiquitin-protein ligase COP1-like isoform X2 [Pomacea canaliculata]